MSCLYPLRLQTEIPGTEKENTELKVMSRQWVNIAIFRFGIYSVHEKLALMKFMFAKERLSLVG